MKLRNFLTILFTSIFFSLSSSYGQENVDNACKPGDFVKESLKNNGYKGFFTFYPTNENFSSVVRKFVVIVHPHTNEVLIILERKDNKWCLLLRGKNLQPVTIINPLEQERDS